MIRASLAQTNHFILQKNYLSSNSSPTPLEVVKNLGGLPATTPTTPFLSAKARIADFTPDQLLTELNWKASLIKSTLTRNVDYVINTDDYVSVHIATVRQRNQGFNAEFRLWGIESNEEMEALGALILDIADSQPTEAESVSRQLPQNMVKVLSQTSRGGRITTTSNVALALPWLAALGKLCRVDESPDWRVEKITYAPLGYRYPSLDFSNIPNEAEAQKALVRAYLTAFGPVTEADISFWTGFGKSETARAVGALSSETTLVMVEGIPGMLLMLKDQEEILKDGGLPAEPLVNVLPANDPFTTAHRASRMRYFSDQSLQRRIFSSSGTARPTIVVNGQIVGTWEWQTDGAQDRVTWQLLTDIDPGFVPLIQVEILRLATFINPQAAVDQKSN